MKKFITIALAVAVLFSFAACKEQTPADNYVVGLETESVPTIIKGQIPSASDYTVTGIRFNGERFTVSASDLKFDFTEAKTASDGKNQKVGTVTYVGAFPYYSSKGSIDLYANIYALEGKSPMAAELTSNADVYYIGLIGAKDADGNEFKADDVFNKNSCSVTLKYKDFDGKTQTRTLSADEYVVSALTIESVSASANNKATLQLDLDKDGTGDSSVTYEITGLVGRTDKIASWSATVKEGFEAIVNANVNSTATQVVTAKNIYASGKVVESTYTDKITIAYPNGYTKYTSGPVSVTVKNTECTGDKTVSITPVSDYITSFTVTGGSVEIGADLTSAALTSFTPTWKSGTTPTYAPSYSFSPSKMPDDAVAEQAYEFVVTLTDQPKAAPCVVSITAKAKAST